MGEQTARLTPLGKLISIVIILGLIGIGGWIVLRKGVGGKSGGGIFSSEAPETEAPDTSGVTRLVASNLPPMPTSRTATSTRQREK